MTLIPTTTPLAPQILVWKELNYGHMREKEKQLVVSEVSSRLCRAVRRPQTPPPAADASPRRAQGLLRRQGQDRGWA